MKNKIAINRQSPKNEQKHIQEYIKLNPSAAKVGDGMDVAAVKTIDGAIGYGLMKEEFNRSRDRTPHRVKDFISTAELRKKSNT